jgi:hypothetical protein
MAARAMTKKLSETRLVRGQGAAALGPDQVRLARRARVFDEFDEEIAKLTAELGSPLGLGAGTKARCAIAALGSYPSTPPAERPRPSHRRWRAWNCLGLRASRQIGFVCPISLGRFRRVRWSAALPVLGPAALSRRSDGVLGRSPTRCLLFEISGLAMPSGVPILV